jgi:hypothetical protein
VLGKHRPVDDFTAMDTAKWCVDHMSKRRSAAASGRVAEHVRANIASAPAPTWRQQPHPHLADTGNRVVRKTPESG